jgi:predicted RNA binding protein YcfA (HicA-like mRNA interferase family)
MFTVLVLAVLPAVGLALGRAAAGKGSHRNFLHPDGVRITLSGRPGDDAKRCQEQEVALRIAAVRAAKGGRK